MTAPALPSFGLARDLGLGQFARLVEQLPLVLWSTDLDLRITAIRGGGAQAGQQGKTIEEAFGNPSQAAPVVAAHRAALRGEAVAYRSEEHTSELQSLTNLVCRLLLEKKKKTIQRAQNDRYIFGT